MVTSPPSSPRPCFLLHRGHVSSKAVSLLKESHFLHGLRGSPYIIRSYGDQITTSTDHRDAHLNVFLEYASEGTLFDLLGSHPRGLPEPHVRFYTSCILEGLHHIHRHDIVHCDIKPANILLAPSFSPISAPFGMLPKIADFGIAKFVGEKIPQKKDKFRGSPPYLAPESVSHGEYEPPCDVWAIGCVALELLTGRSAWGRHALSKSSLLHVIGSTDLLPKVPAYLSDDAKDFLSKCLVRDPEHRWTCEMLLSHPFLATGANQMLKRSRGVKRSLPEVSSSTTHTADFCTDGDEEDSAKETVDFPDYIPLQREKRRKTTSKAVQEVPRLPSYISVNSSSNSSPWPQ